MEDYESNFVDQTCPFCKWNISKKNKDHYIDVDIIGGECESFQKCPKCQEYIKIGLDIYTEYNYYVVKPTKQEIQDNKLEVDKVISDVEGQIFMWNDLLSL